MKISLHNKFEITHNGKTITAYNTLLKGVFTKISKLEQYTSHIAVGKGTSNLDFNAKKLGTFDRSFAATTEEINSNVTNGQLYIKKLVSIDQNYNEEFSFSELGLCSNADFDPDIYNFVLLTDSEGNVVTINRKMGDTLQIRVTIYLDLSMDSDAKFTLGENKFIKRLLGDDFEVGDNNLYALKGENLASNALPMDRPLPSMENSVICSASLTTSSQSANISFSAELGEGETEELLLIYDNQVCLRLSTLEINSSLSEQNEFTCEGGPIVELGKNIKQVNSVTKQGSSESGYTLTSYARKLTDKVENLFELPFNSSTAKYVSDDGSMIAFAYEGQIHLYRNEGLKFKKLNTTQVPGSNIFKLFIMGSTILMLQTISPYIRIFNIENDSAIERGVNLTGYNLTVFPYSWVDAAATIANNILILGLIINNEDKTPLIIRFTKSGNNTYYDNITRPSNSTAKMIYAVSKNPFCQPFVAFVSDKFGAQTMYSIEEFYENTTKYGDSSECALNLLNDSTGIFTSGRAVYSQKSIYPYLVAYYYPNYVFGGYDLSDATKHFFSSDGNYVIAKKSETEYKIYYSQQEKTFIEFENNLQDYFEATDVKDFVFTKDLLLVFTTAKVYGVVLKKQYTRLDNVSDQLGTYVVDYEKYDLPGSHQLEGVMLTFTISFAIGSNKINLNLDNGLKRMINISKVEQ